MVIIYWSTEPPPSNSQYQSNEKRKGADLRLERAARTNKAVRESLGGDDFVSKWTQLSRSRQHEEEPGIGDLPNEKMNKGSKGTGQNFQGKGELKKGQMLFYW